MLGACDGSRGTPPAELLDGTPVRALPITLEGLEGPSVLTRVAVGPAGSTPGARSCLDEQWDHLSAGAISVERRSVYGESVTLREASDRALLACDGRGATSRATGARWCGAAYGLLVNGRLRDPRLDVLCSTDDGGTIGFVWVDPLVAARYVAVEQAGFVEVYATAGRLPVRIATARGVDLERTRVVVPVSEHDRHGRLLRRYDLEAVVAG